MKEEAKKYGAKSGERKENKKRSYFICATLLLNKKVYLNSSCTREKKQN